MIPADAAYAQWLAANRAAIARIDSATSRAVAEKTLAATIVRMQAASPVPQPSTNPSSLAKRELATAGRYDLAVHRNAVEPPNLLQKIWKWLIDHWNAFWSAISSRAHMGSSVMQIGEFLLLLAVGGGIIYSIVRLLGLAQVDPAQRRGTSSPLVRERNARALYLQALALAAAGRYAEAARLLFLAAITALDLRGVLRDDAAATVGEIRRILRARDGVSIASFDAIAAPFVAAAYAERPVAHDEWDRAERAYATLLQTEQA